jgi:hypothetical protein
MAYWTKVGVVDSGIDRRVCLDYDEETGHCSQWDPANKLHPDLNHASNDQSACPPPGQGPEGPEGNEACWLPVLRPTIFCVHDGHADNMCHVSGTTYDFSDDDLGTGFGHGTAVTSIIVGDPLSIGTGDPDPPEGDPGGFYRGTGIAPSAQIVVAKIGEIATSPPPPPVDGMTHATYRELVGQLAGVSARFVTNSWNQTEGYDPPLSKYEYTLFSQVADELVRDADGDWGGEELSETTIVFSGGNFEYQGQNASVVSPANAKNVISAGAARGWSNGVTSGHGECANDEQHLIRDIAGGTLPYDWHSRRGFEHELGDPFRLPRYKPDLVAPGTQVAAGRTRFSTSTDIYQCFGGTSAAAPAVTASAVLAEAWYYYRIDYPNLPSPAMIRALLVAHADNLAEWNGKDWLLDELLPDAPSLAQGWGRVNLDLLFQESVAVLAFDQDHGSQGRRFTASGQFWKTELQVVDPGSDILAVLVYTDRYAEPGATSLTVNELSLNIFTNEISPGVGYTYWGNRFEQGSWYSENLFGQNLWLHPRDTVNTVEVVRIPAGELTVPFWVRVEARTVQLEAVPGLDGGSPNQDFALYMYNAALAP